MVLGVVKVCWRSEQGHWSTRVLAQSGRETALLLIESLQRDDYRGDWSMELSPLIDLKVEYSAAQCAMQELIMLTEIGFKRRGLEIVTSRTQGNSGPLD